MVLEGGIQAAKRGKHSAIHQVQILQTAGLDWEDSPSGAIVTGFILRLTLHSQEIQVLQYEPNQLSVSIDPITAVLLIQYHLQLCFNAYLKPTEFSPAIPDASFYRG